MKEMKRNILFLFIIGVGVIFSYQFFLNFDRLTLSKKKMPVAFKEQQVIHFDDDDNHKEDDSSIALHLSKQVKVLCWVMTSPANHKTKAVHVMATWAKRCNKILFASESLEGSEGLPILLVNTTKGRDHLTAKTMQAFDYIYKHYIDEYDWFLKADDDTYVIVENLRYFLSSKNTNDSVFFGHHFHMYIKQGYFSGGAGYVLSRAALKKFGNRPSHLCREDYGAEDLEIGSCMSSVGVVAGDSRDSLGRSRFHCFTPTHHITGYYPDWYHTYDTYGGKKGISSMSDYAISFHYVDSDFMYLFDFFLYHLRPYGILNYPQDLNGPVASSIPTTLGQPLPSISPSTTDQLPLKTTSHLVRPTTTFPTDLAKPEATQPEPSSTHVSDSNDTTNSKKKKRRRSKRRNTPTPSS